LKAIQLVDRQGKERTVINTLHDNVGNKIISAFESNGKNAIYKQASRIMQGARMHNSISKPKNALYNKQEEDWNTPAIKIMQSKIKQCKNAILK
jgi:hypothetical protein